MNKHTTARRGKRIHVILKNGRQFTDKLKEIKSKYYEFEREGRVMRDDIRSFSINHQNNAVKTT
ncbi:MAG: hypothetical protein Q7R58_02055 [bacterium]|nr:hypothetical protein [bacterium]